MRRFVIAAALLVAASLHAQPRTLSWKALHVDAKLDQDGELRVAERHHMLFNGDWNGGERIFRVPPNQQLRLTAVNRVDGDRIIPLSSAPLSALAVDQYAFDGSSLRWRARRKTDPPFRNRQLVYSIEYTLRNVVEEREGGYVLDHDFAFADRPGNIEAFSLDLDLDPVWRPVGEFNPHIERVNLAPAQSLIYNIPLTYTGTAPPAHVVKLVAQPP
ncbi:MAG TPA: hypothetical protein VM100_06690, partial [Longimicrobiales bacterium]|nr:hypothetical protein [Longimicrobiales bacterium]